MATRVGVALTTNTTEFKDLTLFSGQEKHDNIGFRLFGRFDPGMREHFVFEAGYQRLGDTEYDGLWNGVDDRGTIETQAIEASAGYSFPFTEKFSVGGRVGAAYADIDETEDFGGVPYSSSESGTAAFGGLTLRYNVTDMWTIAASYDRYIEIGDEATHESDVDLFGISVDFRFGGGRNTDE
jgi:hypothetical protein